MLGRLQLKIHYNLPLPTGNSAGRLVFVEFCFSSVQNVGGQVQEEGRTPAASDTLSPLRQTACPTLSNVLILEQFTCEYSPVELFHNLKNNFLRHTSGN
jgi:hypothetical protein